MSPDLRRQIAWYGFTFAVVWFVLGQLISFYPGSEVWWFGIAAGSAMLGLFSPRWPLRVGAIVVGVISLALVWQGYLRGVRYQEWLQTIHPT